MNLLFPFSIKIDVNFTPINAEPSINRTACGIKIDWSAEAENASDSIRVKREFSSNETDSSDLHKRKQSEQRISTLRGIKIE
jgi:hypothetical protein